MYRLKGKADLALKSAGKPLFMPDKPIVEAFFENCEKFLEKWRKKLDTNIHVDKMPLLSLEKQVRNIDRMVVCVPSFAIPGKSNRFKAQPFDHYPTYNDDLKILTL